MSDKPLTDFYVAKSNSDGYKNDCKACVLLSCAARYKANPGPAKERSIRFYASNKPRQLSLRKARYLGDKPGASAQNKAWRENNPERKRAADVKWRDENKPRQRAIDRSGHLRRKFGLTVDQFNEMLLAQDGKCAICRRVSVSDSRGSSLNVDHDHDTGKVRALLCGACNRGLGFFRDDPELMTAAAEYVEKHRAPLYLLDKGATVADPKP